MRRFLTMFHLKTRVWSHVRTVIILAHALAVVVLALPSPGAIADRRRWQAANMQEDLEQWSQRLGFLGYESKDELEDDLWALASGYLEARAVLIAPFEWYGRYTGVQQGWRMFANPRVHIAELHIDIEEGGVWRPVYRPHSEAYDFWGERLRHNRMRKLLGRIGRPEMKGHLRWLSTYLATRAARAYPEAEAVRVRLYRYRSLEPAAVRAGQEPVGSYDPGLTLDAEALR